MMLSLWQEVQALMQGSSGGLNRKFVAHGIAKYFEVSDQVIEKRLIRENLWPPAPKEKATINRYGVPGTRECYN